MFYFQSARRGAADCGEYREVAGVGAAIKSGRCPSLAHQNSFLAKNSKGSLRKT